MPWIADAPSPAQVDVGCHWPVIGTCDAVQADPDLVDWATQSSIEILWAATGRRYGICDRTIRPCLPGCEGDGRVNAWDLVGQRGVGTPRLGRWAFETVTCGRCPGDCTCRHVEEIQLWNKPVRRVLSVTIDGVVLDPANYHRQGSWVIRTDGSSWPRCQDRNAQAGTEGSWELEYRWGNVVPISGQIAAGLYRCQILMALVGDDRCELPERIRTKVVDGQTIGFLEPMTFLSEGLTGLGGIVDQWITRANPAKLQRKARVYRADDPRRTRRRR
jgi:hypothetical protein